VIKGLRLTTKLIEMVDRIGMKGMDQIEPEMRIMSRATKIFNGYAMRER
jgi:hypothetical protein